MNKLRFPDDFDWGSATASYQIEGAYDEDGKGTSIWDVFSHKEGNVSNNDTGDVACDHYHKFKEDIELMKAIGLRSYRFSIAWTRILPEGTGEINEKGIQFYSDLIDALIEADIEPVVTMYHWDLPQALQDNGGWANRDIIKQFENYATILFEAFGDRVSRWITLNEPFVVAFHGNAKGDHAPGIKDYSVALQVAHNLLVAHGRVVKNFRRLNLEGTIGITLNLTYTYSLTSSEKDQAAAQLMEDYINGWFLKPIFEGKYPEKLLAKYTEKYGAFNIESNDMALINQPIDFLGINYYTRTLVQHSTDSNFFTIATIQQEDRDYTAMDWEIYPKGLYDLLVQLKDEYTDIPIYITENGAAFNDTVEQGEVHDHQRIDYLKEHFKSAHQAIQDGVNLKGYFVWSLMDNFEWAFGYSKRFGIIYIDYDNDQKRILKDSAKWYRDVIASNSITAE